MALLLKILKWTVIVIGGSFILLVIGRAIHFYNLDKTTVQVEKIHNTKLTLDDVMGKNLPPNPGAEADKTVAGIDANQNGIRDDVELAIFKEYPNSAKTRAVLLQYALALQMMTNQSIVNKNTTTEVIREKSRAYICVGEILVRDDDNEEIMEKYFEDADKLRSFVENKQINTPDREKYDESFYEKIGSYSESENKVCDIDFSVLPN